mgnify:CR=1 FL=1
MENAYENRFEEYLILKNLAVKTGVRVQELRKLSDRAFRAHLMTLHTEGQPLSGITHYLEAFYSITISPQQLKKIFRLTGGQEWTTAEGSYQQYRQVRRHQKLISVMSE